MAESKDWRMKNLRTMEVSTSMGGDARDNKLLEPNAKDSLSGKNVVEEYKNQGGVPTKNLGGEAREL